MGVLTATYCCECGMDCDLNGGTHEGSSTCRACAAKLGKVEWVCTCGRLITRGEFSYEPSVWEPKRCVRCLLVKVREAFKEIAGDHEAYEQLVFLERALIECQQSTDFYQHNNAEMAYQEFCRIIARRCPFK